MQFASNDRAISHLLICVLISIILWDKRFNAVGVVPFRRNPPYIHVCIDINHTMKHMFQRRRCCVFDSPGLPNDSAGNPGLMDIVWETTP